jgi:ERCC4-related helicase
MKSAEQRYVEHPLIRKETIQSRLYQEVVLGKAVKSNLLCVLPTGLGKTPIAITLAALRLDKFPDSRIMILAPTKPLIEQHKRSFLETMEIAEDKMVLLTGMTKPESREKLYRQGKIIFATPQTVEKDLENKRLSLLDFSLVVFDEAHHAVGDYAYPYIAKRYVKEAENPRILGLTASPGGTKAKIKEICSNLGIEAVEIKTERDVDVAPWVKEKNVEWVDIVLPETFLNVRNQLDKAYRERLGKMNRLGFRKPARLINKRDLIELQARLMEGLRRGNKANFWGVSLVSQSIKIEHALGLIETQGVGPLQEYFRKLRSDTAKSSAMAIKDRNVSHAMFLTNELFEKGAKHPKMSRLCEIVSRQLAGEPRSKIIVFANYRNTVRDIVKSLEGISGAKPVEFMGQKDGFTQKEQKQRIADFRSGMYNVLVTTSVGEEGMDIPEMQLAVFYEPVPSEIRSIQRRGRVGRTRIGKIMILVTRNTRDEAYYWTAMKKENVMKDTLHKMKAELEYPTTHDAPTREELEKKARKQASLEEF